VVVVVGVETEDEVVVEANVTSTFTKGMLASHDTTKTHETVHMVEAGIMGEGDTTNPQVTTPQLNPIATRTEGTHRTAIIRITNRAGTEDYLNHRMNHGLLINSPPTEVFEEGIILETLDMIARMLGRTGTLEGEGNHLSIEGEVRRTVVVGMAIEEVREGGIDMMVVAVDTINPRRTAVMAEVVTVVVVITLMEVIHLVVAIHLVEVISRVGVTSPVEAIILEEVISPVDRTPPASSLMGAEVTTREVEVVGGDINHKKPDAYTVLIANEPTARVCFVHFPILSQLYIGTWPCLY